MVHTLQNGKRVKGRNPFTRFAIAKDFPQSNRGHFPFSNSRRIVRVLS
jgi:hypothetical protein